MPAIAGVIDRQERDGSVCIERMLRMMTHRTGGKHHLFRMPTVQIAGRAGIEPQAFIRHKIIAVVDGDLHHPETLKETLKEKGYACQDDSAEGLLACAYLEWGEECLKKVRGDFVFALFDIAQDLLILGRDAFSKRPLYWFCDAERFLFASELKALMATRLIPNHLCVEGLAAYCALGAYPLEFTPLKGVHKLLAGYFLKIGPQWSPTTHYYGPDLNEWEQAKAQIGPHASVREILQDNFKKQQEISHSVGCLLSGGPGSAALAYLLSATRTDQRIHTWMVGWEGGAQAQPTIQLQQMAHDLSIPFDIVVMQPASMLQEMLSMVWYLDEPVINMEVWSMWKVARMGSTSTQALYVSFGLDFLLPLLYQHRMAAAHPGWGAALHQRWQVLQERIDRMMQRMPQKIRLKWAKSCHPKPQELVPFYETWWASYGLLSKAAPELLHHFDVNLLILQARATKGVTMFFDPFVHLYCMTHVFYGMNQPAERLATAFGLNCQTPYMEYHMLLLLNELMQKDFGLLTQELDQILLPVLSVESLSRLKKNTRMQIPAWSDHPAFIQAFEMLQEGVLVRSGWVLKSWLLATLKSPQRRQAAFGLLLALLQWEMWYKMFIEQIPHEHPPPLSVTQFLYG